MATPTAPEPTLSVYEILWTIQGESTYVGRPCVLVRLAGCVLGCRYCDTPQAHAAGAGRAMALDEIVRAVAALDCPLVEITGGEPLDQAACPELARRLLACDFEVLVETSGCRPIDLLPPGVVRIMDVKCPSSGVADRNDWANLDRLTARDEVKFVIGDRADYEWARQVVLERALAGRCEVLFAPVYGAIDPRALAEWILADRLPVRLQVQLHKVIWGPDAQGV